MLKQLRLFEADATSRNDPPPKPRPASAPHNGTETSKAAADAIRPVTSELARRVYAFIQSRGIEGSTDLEIQAALDIPGDTERPRRRRLEQGGFIRDSGLKRPTPSGCSAVVWIVTDKPFPAE